MRVVNSSKPSATGRLSVTFKAQANKQKKLNERLHEGVQMLLKNEKSMSSVLDTISSTEQDHRLATVTGWSTVNISNCAGISNSSIFLALKWVLLPLKVDMFDFKRSGPEDNMARGRFLVDNLLTANRLKRLQGEAAVLVTCQKFDVRVTPGLPQSVMNAQISDDLKTAVDAALKSRYEPATHTLDLSRFHASPELTKHFCPLHVDKLLKTVLTHSSQIFPQMTGIILSNNYLCSLKAFSGILVDLVSLERLDISANKIQDLEELRYLEKLGLKTIFLAGNGLAKLETDKIHEVLPQLQNIHGCVQSENEIQGVDNLPKFQRIQSGFINESKFCNGFIGSYFDCFDHPEQRSRLKDYYDDQAMFSLSLPVHLNHVYAYKLYNRNQKRLQSSFAHNAKLQVGSAALLLALKRLPLMQTDHQSAGLDIQVFTANLRIFTLTGCFKERTSEGWELRQFQRTFVLRMQKSPGWLITNEMLCITSFEVQPKDEVRFEFISNKLVQKKVDRSFLKTKTGKKIPQVNTPLKMEVDPLSNAVQNMSLSSSNMNPLPKESFDDMPPLVPIYSLTKANVEALEKEIEETMMSEEDAFDLIIDEDVLIGDVY
ncbi:nuclear RNA export factor 1 [Drosophila ficusphila]|uniref:nuclear RNA export factor 1 n=1 Tax=Drosophila ficusphila TaxID=30025 RepID=UPI0007E64EB5|nr:nuclear RNA export factor 1 [Drosophila ficusphila]